MAHREQVAGGDEVTTREEFINETFGIRSQLGPLSREYTEQFLDAIERDAVDRLLAELDKHIPYIDDEIDARLDIRLSDGTFDNADFAIRKCGCGIDIEAYEEYVRHLKEVLRGQN